VRSRILAEQALEREERSRILAEQALEQERLLAASNLEQERRSLAKPLEENRPKSHGSRGSFGNDRSSNRTNDCPTSKLSMVGDRFPQKRHPDRSGCRNEWALDLNAPKATTKSMMLRSHPSKRSHILVYDRPASGSSRGRVGDRASCFGGTIVLLQVG
jgi:hypothetical protein